MRSGILVQRVRRSLATLLIVGAVAVSAQQQFATAAAALPLSAQLSDAGGGTIGCTLATAPLTADFFIDQVFGEVNIDHYTYGSVYQAPLTLSCTDPNAVRRARLITRWFAYSPADGWTTTTPTQAEVLTDLRATGTVTSGVAFGSSQDALADLSDASCAHVAVRGRFNVTAIVIGRNGVRYAATISPTRAVVGCTIG